MSDVYTSSFDPVLGLSFPRLVSSGPTLPHVADSNARLSLTAEGVVVSGAGVAEINTTWTQRGLNEGKPYYNRANDTTDLFHSLKWTTGPSKWLFYSADGVLYYSTEDVTTPDLVIVWTPERDIPGPPPIVTHSPGQVTGAGYQVIQDSDGLTYTFGGDGADADAGLRVTGAGTTQDNDAYYWSSGDNRYQAVNDTAPRIEDAGAGAWALQTDYAISTPDAYPWLQPWTTVAGAPPAPTVLRNPIASEANWSHP